MAARRTTVYILKPPDRPNLQLQWLDPLTGERKTKSARTADPREAEKARADLEYELNHGTHREPSKMAWAAFRGLIEAEYLPGRRRETQRLYRWMLDLVEDVARPVKAADLTTRTVSAFVASLRQKPTHGREGMAPTSIKVCLNYLRAVCRWAVRQGVLVSCPEFPPIRISRRRPQPVADDTFEQLLTATDDVTLQAYLLTGWLAGLRLNEAFTLEWEPTEAAPWVDFGRRRIVLPAALVKADEDQWVPLDPILQRVLEALPRDGRRVFRFVGRTGHPIRAPAVSTRIIRLARRAGVRLTMKSLRRGFGCRYASKVPAQVLQKLMRHSSIATTLEYYVSLDAAAEAAVFGVPEGGNNPTDVGRHGAEPPRIP